jgi:hypothetical protein
MATATGGVPSVACGGGALVAEVKGTSSLSDLMT